MQRMCVGDQEWWVLELWRLLVWCCRGKGYWEGLCREAEDKCKGYCGKLKGVVEVWGLLCEQGVLRSSEGFYVGVVDAVRRGSR